MESSDCHVINLFSEHKNPAKLKFDEFLQHLPKNIIYKIDRDKSFIYFRNDDDFIFIADFGIIVIFGEIPEFINKLNTTYSIEYFPEEFQFENGNEFRVKNDIINCQWSEDKELLGVSFAISQSYKLDILEDSIEKSIQKATKLPGGLAKHGKIKLPKKELAQLRGQLFIDWSHSNLSFELLDTPNYYWENPDEVLIYEKMVSYLEINPRVNILNKKITVINEILTMLSDEQKHRYSSALEIIIILLIFIEIVLYSPIFNFLKH